MSSTKTRIIITLVRFDKPLTGTELKALTRMPIKPLSVFLSRLESDALIAVNKTDWPYTYRVTPKAKKLVRARRR